MTAQQPCLPCRQGRDAIIAATAAVRAGDLAEALRRLGEASAAVRDKASLTASAVKARIQRL
jgi:hypothetical protein